MYLSECYEIVRLKYRVSLDCFFNDFRTFAALSDLCLFSGVTYGLTRGQGEFLSFQQYNLERGKVGEGWKGIDEGCGKWVEPADLPTPH